MITKEEAIEMMNYFIKMNRTAHKPDIEPKDVGTIIDRIYKSVGTCANCAFYSKCTIRVPTEKRTFYCADYTKEEIVQ